MNDVASMGAARRGMAGPPDPSGNIDWAPFEKIRIVAHDGYYAKLVCLLCPADQPVARIEGSLAVVIKWAAQHYEFLHKTQVAARK